MLLALLLSCPKPMTTTNPTFDALSSGQELAGFSVEAVYLDDADAVMGARFVHQHTGFVFAPLRIATAPQAYIWVETLPVSDRGEPHTQEHLLLGKGNKGRAVASEQVMTLSNSSAFTAQIHTAYHFHTTAGPGVFYEGMEHRLDALLHPDYTDEEIRREVHHFGVAPQADGALAVEEKGTVYNEMSSSMQRPWGWLWRRLHGALYGEDHPLAYSAGGLPADIRAMTPEHIRSFHAASHQLGNMGAIAALPPEVALADALQAMDGILRRLQPAPTPPGTDFPSADDLPPPKPIPAGSVLETAYPSADAEGTSMILLAWPPARDLPSAERMLLDLFLQTFAGAEDADLYRLLIASRTRELDTGATEVSAWAGDGLGHPVYISLDGIPAAKLTDEAGEAVRAKVAAALRRVAELPAGDPALVEFNRRAESNLLAAERSARQFVGTPPRFGYRGTGYAWYEHLVRLQGHADFRRSLTLKPEAAFVRAQLADGGNPWGRYLAQWGLLDTAPYLAMNRPDPALLASLEAEAQRRRQDEIDRLKAEYAVEDEQEALRRFQAAYDADTAALEAGIAGEIPRFIDDPPLTLDDPLQYAVGDVAGVPLVSSRFASMSGAHVGLALTLIAVPRDQWPLLSALPTLLGDVGVIEGGEPLSYEQVLERQRREILSLSVRTSANPDSGRVELLLEAAGTSREEAEAALRWLLLTLHHPDWRPENLSRIRDVVDEQLESLRQRPQRAEEAWVQDPAAAWRHQGDPLYLSAASFLTQTYNLYRLRWRLMEPDAAAAEYLRSQAGKERDAAALASWLATLQGEGSAPREVAKLPAASRAALTAIAADLSRIFADVPADALAVDQAALLNQAAADLAAPPADTLAELSALMEAIRIRTGARMYAVGSEAGLAALQPSLEATVTSLADRPLPRVMRESKPWIRERLAQRGVPETAVFVGLYNPDVRGGVFLNSAPLAHYSQPDEQHLLDFLAGRLYGGGGAHSLFMKTWGAGLAYSNGMRASLEDGRLLYYAERCPLLPQTLQFVVDELKRADPGPEIVEYALAQAFTSRAADRYEQRGAEMADDLADGLTPEAVAAFRQALLALRTSPDLHPRVVGRMEEVYGKVLPGYGPLSKDVPEGDFFVIGDDRQLTAYAEHLKAVEGQDATLYRIYPRDFWVIPGER